MGESFFLTAGQPVSNVLAVNVIDTATTLAAAFTLVGSPPLVPANSTGTTVAALNVPTGSTLRFGSSALGFAAVNGRLEPVIFVPEPTAALLAACGLAAAAGRRR